MLLSFFRVKNTPYNEVVKKTKRKDITMFENNPLLNIVVGSVITVAGIVLSNLGGQTLGTGVGQMMVQALEKGTENLPQIEQK